MDRPTTLVYQTSANELITVFDIITDYEGVVHEMYQSDDGRAVVVFDVPYRIRPAAVVDAFEAAIDGIEFQKILRDGGASRGGIDIIDPTVLTDRQREAITTAYRMGLWEAPRRTSHREIATALDITQPSASRLIKIGVHNLLEQMDTLQDTTE